MCNFYGYTVLVDTIQLLYQSLNIWYFYNRNFKQNYFS
jgi:hypothetical protein